MNLRRSFLLAVAVVLAAGVAQAVPTYVAATWSNASINILDENFNLLSSFAAGASNPNGVTAGNGLIYSGHFPSQQVRIFDMAGNFVDSWGAGALPLSNLQGMALVGDELAIANAGLFQFRDPTDGTVIRTLPNPNDTDTEGLAFHNGLLWALNDETILGYDPLTGAQMAGIVNAASGCDFGGTGIASGGAGQLALGCTDGSWFLVSDLDGSVLLSGNNELDMYGLGDITGVPEPATLGLLLLGLALASKHRRRP